MAIFDFLKRKNQVVIDSDETCYQEAMKALRQKDLKTAYRMVCQWNVNKGKSGLGFNWNDELERGINKETESLLKYFYSMEVDLEMIHRAVFCVLSGCTPQAISKLACADDKEQRKEMVLEINYLVSRYSTLRDIQQTVDSGCNQVSFEATLDKNTCPICGKMDGKIVEIKGSVIGKNLPPLHKGCRCTTVPHYDDMDLSDMTRVARDPETGKTYEVSGDMTWTEWKK